MPGIFFKPKFPTFSLLPQIQTNVDMLNLAIFCQHAVKVFSHCHKIFTPYTPAPQHIKW